MEHVALHQALRQGRESKGWTQQQAAAALGVSQKRISEIEAGDKPSMRLLKKAAEAYGLHMAELMTLMVRENHAPLSDAEKELIRAVRNRDARRSMDVLEKLLFLDAKKQ